MASIGLDFTQITPDNGAVRELNKLVFKDVLSAERIGSLLNIFPRVFNGDKLGLVGEFGLVGLEGTGCNPEWGNDAIATEEKTWDIATWQIAEKLCWADVENTLVKYTLATGTDITDMTANDYLDEIVVPRFTAGHTHTKETRIERDTCTPTFITALSIIARTRKQPRCPLVDKWIRKLWYIYTMKYYSALKKNVFESVLMRWMKLEPITQSEVSQERKTPIQYINAYIWNLERW